MNFKELANNIDLEEDEYRELIELFIKTSMSDMDELLSAVLEGNVEKAANAAHSTKGAAANLGLTDISEIAKRIEEKARNKYLDQMTGDTQMLKEKLNVISKLTAK